MAQPQCISNALHHLKDFLHMRTVENECVEAVLFITCTPYTLVVITFGLTWAWDLILFQAFNRVPPCSSGSVLDHRSLPPCSNLGVGISEGCFIFDFASLPLEVARPI